MIKFINILTDKCIEFCILCFGISVIFFAINLGKFLSEKSEEECVSFYKENNYVLKSCEVYRDKLEVIKK